MRSSRCYSVGGKKLAIACLPSNLCNRGVSRRPQPSGTTMNCGVTASMHAVGCPSPAASRMLGRMHCFGDVQYDVRLGTTWDVVSMKNQTVGLHRNLGVQLLLAHSTVAFRSTYCTAGS